MNNSGARWPNILCAYKETKLKIQNFETNSWMKKNCRIRGKHQNILSWWDILVHCNKNYNSLVYIRNILCELCALYLAKIM